MVRSPCVFVSAAVFSKSAKPSIVGKFLFKLFSRSCLTCKYICPLIIELLVENGANINFQHTSTTKNRTALMYECQHNPSAIQYLVENGAKVNCVDIDLQSVLMYACQHNPSVIKYLVENGADINGLDKKNRTPLMYACKYNPSAVQYLVENGAEINCVNKKNKTALMFICKHGQLLAESTFNSIIKFLIDNGANVHFKDNTQCGRTALMIAYDNETITEVVERLFVMNIAKMYEQTTT